MKKMGNEQLNPFEVMYLKDLREKVDKAQVINLNPDATDQEKAQYQVARMELKKFVRELREKGYTI
tara:strand:- start:559 stop:756 length:198 start_codon:yes stop_codon:yes gene_type:complete